MEEAAATAKRMEDESKDARAAAIKLEEENARLRNELAEMRRVNTELAARKIPAPASGTAAPAMAQGPELVQILNILRTHTRSWFTCVCAYVLTYMW